MNNRVIIPLMLIIFAASSCYGQIISQYIETNSGTVPKGVEVWNNTVGTLDFSSNSLVIKKGTNGAAPSADFTLSSGTLLSNAVIVIGTAGDLETTTTGNSSTFHTESFTFNGDDALEVWYGDTKTDVFGNPGSDPGSAWTGGSVSSANQNISLKSGIQTGDTDGWTDPSTRFELTSATPLSDQTGFGIAPAGDGSLPVELSVWKAISSRGLVKLFWTTDSEIENQGFIIERSGGHQDKTWNEIASFTKNQELLGQGSTTAQNDYYFIDKQVKVGKSYSYRLADVDYQGVMTRHDEIKVTVKDAGIDLKPSDVKLHKAFPNPFNPDVNLSFTLENEVAELSLEIYDITGALVQTLSSGYHKMGAHSFGWNGYDSNNNAVSSGVYMVRLSAGSVVQIQRMTLLR